MASENHKDNKVLGNLLVIIMIIIFIVVVIVVANETGAADKFKEEFDIQGEFNALPDDAKDQINTINPFSKKK